MRDVADRGRQHAAFGEILSRGHAVHPLRYRSRFPLSLGGGVPGHASAECPADSRLHGFIPGHPVCRLHLRPQTTGVRLEPMIKFGTSGWRGIIARDFTFSNVRLATQAIAEYLAGTGNNGTLILGYDTRFLGREFSLAAAEVLAKNSLTPLLCNRDTPTPVIAHTIRVRKAAGGINMTASHNPAEYQGLKFSTSNGAPATPEVTRQIEANVE